ncbi:hypothetical protein LMIY3S_05079 [Labrys miyagiensis]
MKARTMKTLMLIIGGVSAALLAASPALAQTSDEDVASIIFLLMLGLIFLLIYFIPSFVAFSRRHANRWAIFVVNLVFGGTGIGWFGSLIWAFGAVHRSDSGSHGGESGLNLFVNDPKKVEIANPAPAAAQPASPSDELLRLKALFDAGALEEAEYKRLRLAPLSRLTSDG